MTTELLQKMKEQIELASAFGFPYVFLTVPVDEARRLIEEHEIAATEPVQRVYDL